MAGAASWSFSENDFKQIQQHLQAFLRDSNARCALLVDRAGQLVATVGDPPKFDSTAFASLTAADFSANDQLARSEEHTSELQSLAYLVCRLLLEKKNTTAHSTSADKCETRFR